VIHHLWQHQGVKFSDEFFHMCSETGFSHPNTQDGSGWTCLHRAAAFGTARDIKALLKLGASMTMYTSQHAWTPIHVAAVMNNLSTLTALSAQVSAYTLHSPDAHGWTPLHLAVYREAEDTMRFLLKNGANPHAQSNITATWFPVGLEHQILRPGDLALEYGDLFLGKYADALRDAGWQVTTGFDGDDIYWDSLEYLV
jgi:ankyrin repeat protein